MSWLGRLFRRPAASPLSLVMGYRNDTAAAQRVVLEPLGRAFIVAPGRTVEIFDHVSPDDPFVRIDNRGGVVTIYRWMTAELVVKLDGSPVEPSAIS